MNGWAQLLVGVLAVAGTVLTTWLTVRRAGKRDKIDTTQQLIDQLQEERDASDKRHAEEISALRRDVGELRSRLERMEDREFAFYNHVDDLRDHIYQGRPPPPPPWPSALLRRQ